MVPGVTEMSSTGCDVTPCWADSVALLSGLLTSPGRLHTCKFGIMFVLDRWKGVGDYDGPDADTQQQLLLGAQNCWASA